MMEGQTETNNVTVDNIIPQRNKIDDLINKLSNMTINNIGNDLDRANASDIQVRFADNQANFSPKIIEHQKDQD